MKQKVLIDVKIECEEPRFLYWDRSKPENRVLAIERWVKDFHDFIRDHRSQDPVFLSVERTYQEQCSYCNREWEEDVDGPLCCNAAQKEWDEQKILLHKGGTK